MWRGYGCTHAGDPRITGADHGTGLCLSCICTFQFPASCLSSAHREYRLALMAKADRFCDEGKRCAPHVRALPAAGECRLRCCPFLYIPGRFLTKKYSAERNTWNTVICEGESGACREREGCQLLQWRMAYGRTPREVRHSAESYAIYARQSTL